jgi:hypothetical protein
MKRLILFALVCAAAWYGWKNYARLAPEESHQVVVVNHSGHAIERVRISGGGETVVVETLADGASASHPMRAQRDGSFHVVWKTGRQIGEREWSGGKLTAAPELMTYRFEFDRDDRMRWSSARKPAR